MVGTRVDDFLQRGHRRNDYAGRSMSLQGLGRVKRSAKASVLEGGRHAGLRPRSQPARRFLQVSKRQKGGKIGVFRHRRGTTAAAIKNVNAAKGVSRPDHPATSAHQMVTKLQRRIATSGPDQQTWIAAPVGIDWRRSFGS